MKFKATVIPKKKSGELLFWKMKATDYIRLSGEDLELDYLLNESIRCIQY